MPTARAAFTVSNGYQNISMTEVTPPSSSSAKPSTLAKDAPPPPDLPPLEEPSVPPLDPGPCAEGGRLWDGKLEDCSYEHGGCCYESAADACAAAGCPVGRCNVLESYPAQISCR